MLEIFVTAAVIGVLRYSVPKIIEWVKDRQAQKRADERARAEAAEQADKLKKAQTSTDGEQVEDGIKDSLGQL